MVVSFHVMQVGTYDCIVCECVFVLSSIVVDVSFLNSTLNTNLSIFIYFYIRTY